MGSGEAHRPLKISAKPAAVVPKSARGGRPHIKSKTHSSMLLNNATSHSSCIAGRPVSRIRTGRLSHVRVGLLVIKLVVMPLPQVLRTAFAAKAPPLKGWKSTGATHCPTWSLHYFTLVFLAGAIQGDRTGFPTLQITVLHHESQGDYNWRKKNPLQRVPHVTRNGIIKEKEEEEDDEGQGKGDE